MTRESSGDEKPIGFWIKQVDAMFEASIASLLGARQLTRRHWRLLNVLSRGPVTRTQCDEELQVFLEGDGTADSASLLDHLVNSGLARLGEGGYLLTDRGLTVFRDLQERVVAWRGQMLAGISAEDYELTIAFLKRMCSNMSSDITA